MRRGEGSLDWKTAYLGMGSNLGDRVAHMRMALGMIRHDPRCSVGRVSSLYNTQPVGVTDQPEFLNGVVEIRTSLSPVELLHVCQGVERKMGRTRTIRWGPRVIDLDILVYETETSNAPELVIPHPRLRDRAFVLAPLAEIAPDVGVGDGLTASNALSRLSDQGVSVFQDGSWAE